MRNQGRIWRRGFPGCGGNRVPDASHKNAGARAERRQRRHRALLPGRSAAPAVPDVRRRPRAARRPARVFDLRPRSAGGGGTRHRETDRADRRRAEGRARSPGQPGGDESGIRRRLRAGRRTRFPREQLQPRHPGAAAGGIGVQADHLRGSARARLRAGHAAQGSRSADRRRRRPGCRTASTNATSTPCAAR